jgi:hypothetical protein
MLSTHTLGAAMKFALSGALAIALLGASLSSCNKSASGSTAIADPVILPAVKLDAPSTIGPGATLTATVTLSPGSCTTFDRVDIKRVGPEVRLTAWGIFHGPLPCVYPEPLVKTVQVTPPFPSTFVVIAVQPAGSGADLFATVSVR